MKIYAESISKWTQMNFVVTCRSWRYQNLYVRAQAEINKMCAGFSAAKVYLVIARCGSGIRKLGPRRSTLLWSILMVAHCSSGADHFIYLFVAFAGVEPVLGDPLNFIAAVVNSAAVNVPQQQVSPPLMSVCEFYD